MSKDAEIMDALKSRLSNIRKVNGYQTEIGTKVHVWRSTPLGIADVPAITIDDTDIEHDNSAIMGMTRNKMTVEVVMVLSGASSLQDARKARSDLKKCIHGFETVGGLASYMELVKTTIEMKQFEDVIAGVTGKIEIIYDTLRSEI